jgi:adenosylhomocysteinase
MNVIASDITDLAAAEEGQRLIDWAAREMTVLWQIRTRFEDELPLADVRIGACLHVTPETANLMLALKAGGAQVSLCASNPRSTRDAVAAALVRHHIPVFAKHGEDNQTYYSHINAVLDSNPHITMDDGADLVSQLHMQRAEQGLRVWGGTEETTTGVIRLRALASDGKLAFPLIAVNEAKTKHMFDNQYGTGQSTVDGLLRATNMLIAGKTIVVCGYGWCGRGLARRMAGMGAHVVVTEVDPVRALEAVMDGFRVSKLYVVAPRADVVITVTGDVNVVDKHHLEKFKNGCILANSGHFNDEINIPELKKMSKAVTESRKGVETYHMHDGRELHLLEEGRLLNLAAAEGHPAAVMDMSFANQALCVEYLVKNHQDLRKQIYNVPEEIDQEVAVLKLVNMGMEIDVLTDEQHKYMKSWHSGTS